MMYSVDTSIKAPVISLQTAADRPIRVLYYIAYYQRMAGANRCLFELITRLPETVIPLVVVAGEGRVAEAYRTAGVEVQVLPPGASLNQFGKVMLNWSPLHQAWVAVTELLPYTLQCLSLIRDWQPDIVHVNDTRGSLLIGTAAHLSNCAVVGHLHGELPFGGISQTIFETVTDRIITVCSAIRTCLSSVAQAKAITIYNGVQTVAKRGKRIPWLASLKAEGKLIVGCFASIVPFKGHHHLLQAVAELNRRGWRDRAIFVCVGDLEAEYQDHANWLMQLQRELEIDNLIFTGWQSDPFPFYEIADIEVLPSVRYEQLNYGDKIFEVRGNEGFPLTHLEAMHFGLPVIGTDIAGICEQIEPGVNGLIVPPADPIALANALETLLENPDLRSQMGKAGRDQVQEKFSMATNVTQILEVYQSLLPALTSQ